MGFVQGLNPDRAEYDWDAATPRQRPADVQRHAVFLLSLCFEKALTLMKFHLWRHPHLFD